MRARGAAHEGARSGAQSVLQQVGSTDERLGTCAYDIAAVAGASACSWAEIK